ncbi:sugar ABC transporter ATP-binding protein [Aquibaculum sediminis]|uniref:sugar ABC transporter ATP-binding protein n=1 Tax=Aquibaculum sediminis TaxID=3231907 RepID=UPI0034539BFE
MDDVTNDSGSQVILQASQVCKTFGQTRALDNAEFELRVGEVHGLLGANGAGKSTLSKVIAGHVFPDSGKITYRNRALSLRSAREALDCGIAIVMQETSLAPDMSVLENIFLPELGKPGRLSYRRLRQEAKRILSDLVHEHALPLDTEVRRLSSAQRQLVEIAKALALDASLIIFDEPTASLSPNEVEQLFGIMSNLRDNNKALIFVSHRMEEVFAITDRVTVMREGATVAKSIATRELTQTDLVRHMVGREIGSIYAVPGLRASDEAAPETFAVEGLRALPAVKNVSFRVHRGEILGLGGLVGAGRSETAEALFGLRPYQAGQIHLNGKPFRPRKPRDCVKAGIGFVAEDRRVQSIVPDLSVRENLLLAHLGAHSGFLLNYSSRREKIAELLDLLDMPASRLLDANMLNFSGGMQQKIIIARWLMLDPSVLILDEPTKGVDIGTRSSIYSMLRRIAERGVSIVMISSDFEELLGVCERIIVMSDGQTIADLPSAHLDEEKLTLLAAPRTSTERNTKLLQELTQRYGGAGFWAIVDEGRVICLNAVVAEAGADPGFRAGESPSFDQTAIPTVLQHPQDDFVAEPNGERRTFLMPIPSKRGHDLGWIGLVTTSPTPPSVQDVRDLIIGFSALDHEVEAA